MKLVNDWALPMSVVSVSKNPLFINSAVIFSIFKHENDDSQGRHLVPNIGGSQKFFLTKKF